MPAALLIFLPCKVVAVTTMIANITAFENAMPVKTSPRAVRDLYLASLLERSFKATG